MTHPSSVQSVAQADYVLGTDPAEAARLGLQHRLWSDAAHAAWKHAAITPGQTVLDLGSGPGHASFDLAQLVGPTGVVHAVEESATYVHALTAAAAARHLGNIRPHHADVQRLESTAIPPASVDLAWARWVLCFVPDPAAVVRGVARLLKPGGRFIVFDYFDYATMTIAPRSRAYQKVIDATAQSWRSRGGDPDVVGRLPGFCREAGLDVTRLHLHHRLAQPPAAAGANSDNLSMWAWPDTWWRTYVPKLIAMGAITQADADAFFAHWNAAAANPSAFAVCPPVYELIATKR
ncbi:MAG: methyltransferase domain-containing protein [Phycisphaerales bacterium]|nr:methyltransferase domain-containing protein [Phycisphaerales bacterium]